MSVRRMIGCLVLLVGMIAAIGPFLASVPDDAPFLGVLREKNAPGEWTSQGWIDMGGKTYSFEIEQKEAMNKAGDVVSMEATLHAKEPSGQTKVYRRTRYFDEYGYTAETLEETPTQTTKKGRGPTGKDSYQEMVLSDSSPLLARPPIRWASHATGGILVLGGLVLLLLPGRTKRGT